LEGGFNVRSHAEGAGRTVFDLIAHTRGGFELQSRKGIFRGLQQAAASRAAGFVSGLLSTMMDKVESLAMGADVATQLAAQLAELPYDQLTVRVSRDQSLNIKLADFTLVSPTVRLQGEGLITYEKGRSVLDQPMQVRVNMGVMGSTEDLLTRSKLPLLAREQDELGYRKLREPFVIGGTLAKPDSSQLYSTLGRSFLDMLLLR
jgi:hypothetical protein